MADESMALLEGVRKAIEEGDGDFLLEAVNLLAQGITEAEMAEQVVRPLALSKVHRKRYGAARRRHFDSDVSSRYNRLLVRVGESVHGYQLRRTRAMRPDPADRRDVAAWAARHRAQFAGRGEGVRLDGVNHSR